jgi:hypothetical protein
VHGLSRNWLLTTDSPPVCMAFFPCINKSQGDGGERELRVVERETTGEARSPQTRPSSLSDSAMKGRRSRLREWGAKETYRKKIK